MSEKFLYWLKELRQHHNNLVGKKCANLGEMTYLGLPVPPGFAISVKAYEYFLENTNSIQEIKDYLEKCDIRFENIDQLNDASLKIRQIIESKDMPEVLKKSIYSFYDDLCQICCSNKLAVATRSAGPVSRPGQYETYLNVKGKEDLLEKIKKVWASTFNPRSLLYRLQKGLPLESDPIGVAVLKMVKARSAGIIFTVDPNTGDYTKMILEANWGLGESVVSGELIPDTYIVEKETLQICEKKLGAKQKYVIFREIGVIEEETPPLKRCTYCLMDEEVIEIGKLAKVLEKHFGTPQDAEWAIEEDSYFPENIIFLQTRPAMIRQKKSPIDQIVDLMLRRF
jgi:pyruvate,water dikinase